MQHTKHFFRFVTGIATEEEEVEALQLWSTVFCVSTLYIVVT